MATRRVTRSSALLASAKEPTPTKDKTSKRSTISKSSAPRSSKKTQQSEPDEISLAIAEMKKAREDRAKYNIEEIRELKKSYYNTIKKTQKENDLMESKRRTDKPSKTTRSGLKRGSTVERAVYSNGEIVNKGIDQAQDRDFDQEERDYLKREISKVKKVCDLTYDHLRYLIQYVFLDELKKIKAGELKSKFHTRYEELRGKSKNELFSEVRTSLFTNEQRDFINGFLQGIFDTVSKDANGDIKHQEMNYVEIVMLAETIIRIVKYVHNFESYEETHRFMVKSSREAYGIEDDDDDDEDDA